MKNMMATPELGLGWDNDHETQALYVRLGSWHCGMRVVCESHGRDFNFEGTAWGGDKESKLNNRPVKVTINIVNPKEGSFSKTGYFNLDSSSDLSVNLNVSPKSYEELFRVFSAAFGNNGNLMLSLQLKHEKGGEPNFWRTGWQQEYIEVSEFELNFNGSLRHYPTKGWAKVLDPPWTFRDWLEVVGEWLMLAGIGVALIYGLWMLSFLYLGVDRAIELSKELWNSYIFEFCKMGFLCGQSAPNWLGWILLLIVLGIAGIIFMFILIGTSLIFKPLGTMVDAIGGRLEAFWKAIKKGEKK